MNRTDLDAAVDAWLAKYPPPRLTERQKRLIVDVVRSHYVEQARQAVHDDDAA